MFPYQLKSSDKDVLERLTQRFETVRGTFLGYPTNLDFDYSELDLFLKYSLNNVGDPFRASNLAFNSHEIEREVMRFFFELTNAPDVLWGYVTNGGTEGNLYGLYVAREMHPNAIVYFSRESHYSATKIIRLLNCDSQCIDTLDNGEIDYVKLQTALEKNIHQPAIIFANLGTTMKGACDDVDRIKTLLKQTHPDHHYIHADAALSGMILPFCRHTFKFDFAHTINSMAISGHKLIGSPIPCGIVIVQHELAERVKEHIEYINAPDLTITGSRNGITPIYLWYAIKRIGPVGFRYAVRQSLKLADYAVDAMQAAGINAWRNQHSITVVFPRPSDALLKRWIIAVHNDIAHIITLPHVTHAVLDQLISDLVEDYKRAS